MGRQVKFPPTVHHHHKGYDFCRIRGDEVYLGRTGSKEAALAYSRLVAEIAAARGVAPPPRAGLTVASLVERYLLQAAKKRGDGRAARRREKVGQTLVGLYGPTPAAEFGPLALEACREEWVRRGHCRTQCNSLASLCRRFFKWGARMQLVGSEVYGALRLLEPLREGETEAPESPARLAVADEVVLETIPFCTTPVAAMVRLQLLTGMRPGEVVVVRPLDVERHWAEVDGVVLWLFTPHKHKNGWRGQKRDIPLGPQAQLVLLPFLSREPAEFCFSPKEAMAEVFARGHRFGKWTRQEPGESYTAHSYGRAIANAVAKANRAGVAVPHWSPNQIRKAVATRIDDLDEASCVLGHRKTDVTDLHYRMRLTKAARVMARSG